MVMTTIKLTRKELRAIIMETLNMSEDDAQPTASDEEGTLSLDEDDSVADPKNPGGPAGEFTSLDELEEAENLGYLDEEDDLDEYGAVGADPDAMDDHLMSDEMDEDGSFGSANVGVGSSNPIESQNYSIADEDEDDLDEEGGPIGMGHGPGWL